MTLHTRSPRGYPVEYNIFPIRFPLHDSPRVKHSKWKNIRWIGFPTQIFKVYYWEGTLINLRRQFGYVLSRRVEYFEVGKGAIPGGSINSLLSKTSSSVGLVSWPIPGGKSVSLLQERLTLASPVSRTISRGQHFQFIVRKTKPTEIGKLSYIRG